MSFSDLHKKLSIINTLMISYLIVMLTSISQKQQEMLKVFKAPCQFQAAIETVYTDLPQDTFYTWTDFYYNRDTLRKIVEETYLIQDTSIKSQYYRIYEDRCEKE